MVIRAVVVLVFLMANVRVALGDATIVFNEVMYHPATNEAQLEWVELHSLMSVDMDISGWSLANGIDYMFPAGTIFPGGGYLVLAVSPGTLMAATGLTNVMGPFSGRLSNSGETLELRDNNQRVVDSLNYGTSGAWPIAPDGGGASLAKRNPNGATADASNWSASAQVGGTPGAENFPTPVPTVNQTGVVDILGSWKFNDTGVDLGTAWRDSNFNDSSWNSGQALFYRGSASLPAVTNTVLAAGRTTYYFRTRFSFTNDPASAQLQLQPLIDDGAVFYLNGVEVSRFNMPGGAISYTNLASAPVAVASFGNPITIPGSYLVLGTNVLAVEVHQARATVAYPQAVLNSSPVGYWRLGETASPIMDSASAAAAPQSGAQNGVLAGVAATNLAQAGPRPGDVVSNQVLAGFELNNLAPRFAGTNDGGNDVVTITDPGVFNFTSNRTLSLEAWVNGAPAQESGAAIVSKGYGGGGEQYSLDVQGGHFRFYVRDNTASHPSTVALSSNAPNYTWQYVVAVYDQAASRMQLWVNNALAASGTTKTSLLDTSDPISIGSRKSASSAGYDLNFDGRIDEVAIYNRALTTNEIAAHFNAAFDSSTGAPTDTNDIVFGMQVTAFQTLPLPRSLKLAFNEVAAATNTFWLEVINNDTTNADLTGCVITRLRTGSTNRDYIFPAQSLGPGTCLEVTKATMGFGADPGDKFILYGPGGAAVLDAFVADDFLHGRHPDGAGPWLYPNAATPGASNSFALHNEIVINEIMYHPYSVGGTNDSPGQWIELLNRGSNTVSLAGWHLAGGIQYAFPVGATMSSGAYLVAAADPAALGALHPGIAITGPWSGKLSHSSDTILLNDASNNPVNQLLYYDAGRWPEYADGVGASLELKDPHADNTKPETWTASNEGAHSAWQTYTYRGVSQNPISNLTNLWNELDLGITDGAGEFLLDDVSVIENPDTAPVQFIQNGSFDGGSSAHWRCLGTHRRSRVESESGNPSNYVLHVIATGPCEYTGNLIETTFATNHVVTDGRTYEISFRAKWLAGHGLLNTRLYFDRLARTTQLLVPATNGTPGAANTAYAGNIGPTYSGLQHQPVIPAEGAPVTISVAADDPDGIASITLWYGIEGASWTGVTMTNGGSHVYSATLPGQVAGSLIQFYVEGRDTSNAFSYFPVGGTNSRALYRVDDGQETAGLPKNFRVLTTAVDANFLHANTNVLSNGTIGCTLINDEREVFYDVGVRLKGSFVGRNVARVGFTLDLDPSQLFRGVFDTIAIDRSQGATIGQAEIMTKHMANHAGNIPGMYDDLVHFIAPRSQDTSQGQLRMAAYGDVYLNTAFKNGSDGPMYEIETPRFSTVTSDGTPEGIKLPGNGFINLDIKDYGTDKETYRWWLLQANNRTADDFWHIIPMCQAFSLTGTNLDAQSQQFMAVDDWLRVFAYESLVGVSDAYFTGGNDHNFRMYVRPDDQKVLAMPWDWDSSYNRSATANLVGGANLAKIVNLPNNLRTYYNHLYDIINTTFNTSYMSRWTAHYGSLANQDFSSILNYIGTRANFVLGQMPTNTSFAITSNNGNNFLTNNTPVTISGTAPVQVKTILVNGVEYAVTWTSLTNWTLTLPLATGTNFVVAQGYDAQGLVLSNAADSIVITNLGPGAPLPVVINEWMADNAAPDGFPDPLDGAYKDWIELYNPNTNAFNLSSYYLTDDFADTTKWRMPTNTVIAAHGFLLVWADGKTNLNALSTNGDLHTSFQLSKSGESIGLYTPDGVTAQSTVVFGAQLQNMSQGRYPDGPNGLIYFMGNFTPRSANTLPPLQFTQITVTNGVASLAWQAIPAQTYRLQYNTNLADGNWTDITPDITGSNKIARATAPATADAWRFYRVRWLQ